MSVILIYTFLPSNGSWTTYPKENHVMSLKIIQKNIKQITTSAAKLNMLIHTTGMLVIEHARPQADGGHGDCSIALNLINAMPASMRRTMLKLWFETYSPIRFQMKDGLCVKVGMLKDTAKGFTPFNVDDARENPFFTLAEQNPEGKVLDFDAILNMVKGLSKRIDKQVEEGKVKPEDVASARAASISLAGLRLVRVEGAPLADGQDEPVQQPDLGLRVVNG